MSSSAKILFVLSSFAASLLLAPAPALAGGVSDYTGKYDLGCSEATLTLHVIIAGKNGSWSGDLPATLHCDPDNAQFLTDLAKLTFDLTQTCVKLTTKTWTECEKEVTKLTDGIYALNKVLVEALPVSGDLKVTNANNWLAKLLNLFVFKGSMTLASQKVVPASFFINDKGKFWVLGLKLLASKAASNGGCISMAVANVNGDIHRAAGFSLEAKYGINANITCGGGIGTASWLALNAGITFHGKVKGKKAK